MHLTVHALGQDNPILTVITKQVKEVITISEKQKMKNGYNDKRNHIKGSLIWR